MRWRSESELTVLIGLREREIASLTMSLPNGTSELSEELLTALVELEDLRNELQFVRNNPTSEEDQLSAVLLKPLPHLNSGAIALPESDDSDT